VGRWPFVPHLLSRTAAKIPGVVRQAESVEDKQGTVLDGFSGALRPIAEEIYRLWWWAQVAGQVQFQSNHIWRVVNWATSGAASVLAAATGASALADLVDRVWVGIGSLTAAVLAAMAAVAAAKERAVAAAGSGNAYIEIRDDARQLLQVDLEHMDRATARQALTDLTVRYHAVNQTAEPPLSVAMWSVVRALRRAPAAGPSGFELNASWPAHAGDEHEHEHEHERGASGDESTR